MRGLALICLWIGLLVGSGLYFGWTDEFHLIVGAALLVIPGVLTLWIVRRRGSDEFASDEELAPHPIRAVLLHGAGAMLCVGYLLMGFQLLHAAGFGMSGFDRDPSSLEEKLQILEEARQFDRAAEIIEERLGQRISESWRQALAERLCRNLLDAGQQCTDLTERRKRFTKAVETARRHRIDAALALLLDEEARIESDYLNRVCALRTDKDWATLAMILEAGLDENTPRRRHLPQGVWLRDCLVEWSKELKDGRAKSEKLSRALDVCSKYNVDDQAVKLAVAFLDKEIRERTQPVPLPHGAKGGITCVAADYYPPAVIADIWVDLPDGRPFEKLAEKDFQVYWGGKKLSEFVLHEETRDVVPMQLIVAIDTSGSMKGPAIAAAEDGARSLIEGLHPLGSRHGQMWIEVLTFHGEIIVRTPWTKDLLSASSSLKGLKADGSTALFKTVERSVVDFRGRPGRKHLLLFTDGKDMEGGPDVTTLVAMCKKEGVMISAIGLRSDDLDVTTLRRLSSETGGSYAEADGPPQLLEQFRQAGAQLRPHFYRLVLLPKAGGRGPLEVRVGGENSLLLKESTSR